MANDRNLKRKRPQSAAPSAAPRNESRAAPFVVGIVASAGGLNALKKFFEAMPAALPSSSFRTSIPSTRA